MRTADTILGLIRERGKKGLPLERVYKLLVLCKRCHEDVEHGLPLKRPAISLAEVKAFRKKARTLILESRMQ